MGNFMATNIAQTGYAAVSVMKGEPEKRFEGLKADLRSDRLVSNRCSTGQVLGFTKAEVEKTIIWIYSSHKDIENSAMKRIVWEVKFFGSAIYFYKIHFHLSVKGLGKLIPLLRVSE